MLNNRGSSKTDTLIKLVLFSFLILFSFSVGTFLGKKFSDKQHKIAQIESSFGVKGDRSTASVSPDVLEVKPEQALTDADIASITEEFSQSESNDLKELLKEAEAESQDYDTTKKMKAMKESLHKDTHEKHVESHESDNHDAHTKDSHHKTTRKQASVAKTNSDDHKVKLVDDHSTSPGDVAHRVAANKKAVPEIKKKMKTIPKALPKVAEKTEGKYTVQIASYKTEDEAKNHAKELQEKGLSSFYVEAKIKTETWYRVSIGLFANQKKAFSYMNQLKKQGHVKSAFIAKLIR